MRKIEEALAEVTDCLCRDCERSEDVKEALLNLIGLVYSSNYDSALEQQIEEFLEENQ